MRSMSLIKTSTNSVEVNGNMDPNGMETIEYSYFNRGNVEVTIEKEEGRGEGEVGVVEWVMKPVQARLLLFESSIENIHRVNPVSSGQRLSLSVWFSRSMSDTNCF